MSNSNKPFRVSVSFDKQSYAEINRIAEACNVSASWVVRQAVVEYLKHPAPESASEILENDRD